MPAAGVRPGSRADTRHVVENDDTARALGSGDLDVLGTPRLLAWLEGATCTAMAAGLAAGETSVGTRFGVEHLKASPLGATVVVRAEVGHVDGRLVRFQVMAEHPDGTVIGQGEITRVVVDIERFLSRVEGAPPNDPSLR